MRPAEEVGLSLGFLTACQMGFRGIDLRHPRLMSVLHSAKSLGDTSKRCLSIRVFLLLKRRTLFSCRWNAFNVGFPMDIYPKRSMVIIRRSVPLSRRHHSDLPRSPLPARPEPHSILSPPCNHHQHNQLSAVSLLSSTAAVLTVAELKE